MIRGSCWYCQLQKQGNSVVSLKCQAKFEYFNEVSNIESLRSF